MKIKRGRLEFNNVLGYKVNGSVGDLLHHIAVLKAMIVANDVCATGPIIVCGDMGQDDNDSREIIIYAPIHREVEVHGENKGFFFQKKLQVEHALKIRHTEIEDDIKITEDFLNVVAIGKKIKLKKPFYYVYLPVYQEYVIDIWAEIDEE